jgi:hypothetical protein
MKHSLFRGYAHKFLFTHLTLSTASRVKDSVLSISYPCRTALVFFLTWIQFLEEVKEGQSQIKDTCLRCTAVKQESYKLWNISQLQSSNLMATFLTNKLDLSSAYHVVWNFTVLVGRFLPSASVSLCLCRSQSLHLSPQLSTTA